MTLLDCIKVYITHNIECITKEITFDKKKAQDRLEIVEGLLRALEDIDNIIELIKKSESAAKAKDGLITKYNFTEPQAKAIVDMKLGRLAGLEKIEIMEEKSELLQTISHLDAILANPQAELRIRLEALVKTYGDARRTVLSQVTVAKEEKEIQFVEPEKCVVVLTEAGTIKRIPTTSFKAQKRNGKGIKTQEDIASMVLRTNTIDSLMIFSNKGQMYRLLVNDIPAGINTTKGTPVKALVSMAQDEEPATMYSIYRDTDAKYVLFVTKNGAVKKTTIDEYIGTKKKTGIGAITLKDGDSLAAVSLVKDEPLVIITKQGYMIKFDSMEVGATSRMTAGVKGIALNDGDEVVAALPVRNADDAVAVFTETGLAKKMLPKEVVVQKRGGKGLICYKPTNASGNIVAAAMVSDEDNILIVGNKSSICVAATDIPALGRTGIGNQMIKSGKVSTISKV
jgi:DNA gyrase subunit A